MRVRSLNERPFVAEGAYVLYWMCAYRRAGWNFALEHAADLARSLRRPLLVLEALRSDYPFASDRLHAFVLQGMADNRAAFEARGVTYYPYVEPSRGAGKGLLAALARDACAVVGDDYPGFFLPRMAAAAARQVPCRFEAVDSNGLLPLSAAPRAFARAVDFRRFLQKNLAPHLAALPSPDPLRGLEKPARLAARVTKRWPRIVPKSLDALPIDHGIGPVAMLGGTLAARKRLRHFLREKLLRYPDARGDPDADATSRLSPYLHFGHLSPHEIFAELAKREGWSPAQLPTRANGKKTGWWGMSAPAEAFLDELVTWRELGFNFCAKRPQDYARYESLPGWALNTLNGHARDRREHRYPLEALEKAQTHDPLWNAAQRQLVREGWFHGYLRMLWGKKILEWSRRPQDALAAMSHLMNRYSLDGRDPNSWSGYFWVLGRYDRPWGPERRVFGTVRYMSSANTARKRAVKDYLNRYA